MAGRVTLMVCRPPSTSRVTRAAPSSTFSSLAKVAWDQPSRAASFAAIALVAQPASPRVPDQAKPAPTVSPFESLGALRIAGYIRTPDAVSYSFVDDAGSRISGADLAAKSITIEPQGPREAVLHSGPHSITVYR